jgi:hypothetical protein
MKAQNYAMIINAQQNLKTAQQAEAAAAEAAAGQESVNDFKFVINDYPQQVRETVLFPPLIFLPKTYTPSFAKPGSRPT